MTIDLRRQRVIHITNTFDDDGCGITNMIIDLADAQLKAGYRVEVFSSSEESSAIERLVESGGSYTQIPRLGDAVSVYRASRIVRNSRRGAIIHVHTVRALAVAFLAMPVRWSRLTVATLHNEFQRSAALMKFAGAAVCVSEGNFRSAMQGRWGPRRNLRCVKNGVIGGPRIDLDDAAEERGSCSDSSPSILYVGGMEHRKGVDLLVRRFSIIRAELPEVRLDIVGNAKQEICDLVDELGLREHVRFLGFHSRPASFMKSATVVAVPSRREPFGLVALEARAVGAVVVASDVDGLRDALSDGRGGVLIDPYDEERWLASLVALLSDPEKRSQVRSGAQVGLEEFSASRMARGYGDVYAELK